MKKFKQLGISIDMLRSIEELGFEQPTPIQEKSIPLIIKGKNIVAGAATGSGKTLAFGTAIVNSESGKGIQALVLTPTRELAVQVNNSLMELSKYRSLRFVTVYGGVSINHQIHGLKKADVVVGTPGRILDHLQRGTINLQNVRVLVLDEADRMLDMGFIDDVERIISNCSKNRQTLLFSATINDSVNKLARRFIDDFEKISVECFVDPTKLKQIYYDVPRNQKFSLLLHLLKQPREGLAMVFCNTRRNVDFIAKNLKSQGVHATAIHGGFTQAKRNRSINSFLEKDTKVLVCTDVAARGLHIPDVSQVYNYDLPKESNKYIHRIGRTARAGEQGIAINLLSDIDHDNFSRIFRDFSVTITKEKTPETQRVKLIIADRGRRRGSRGRFGNHLRGHSRNNSRNHSSGQRRRYN